MNNNPVISSNSRLSQLSGATLVSLLLAILTGALIARMEMVNLLAALALISAVSVVLIAIEPWRGVVLLLIFTQISSIKYDVAAFTIKPEHFVLVVVFVCLGVLFLSGRFRFHATILDVPILGLFGVGFLSSFLNSGNPRVSFQGLALELAYMSMYFFTASALLEKRRKIDLVIKILMVTAVLQALYAMIAFVAYLGAKQNIGGIAIIHFEGFPSVRGMFGEPNLFGAFASITLMLFAAHLVIRKGSGIFRNSFLYLGFILLLFGILTSLTRSAWLAVALSFMVLLFYARPRMNFFNPRALSIIVLVVILPLMLVLVSGALSSKAAQVVDDVIARAQNVTNVESGTGSVRVRVEQAAINGFEAHPLIGNGVFSARTLMTVSGEESSWLFGTLAQNANDTGLAGLFFMLWIHLVPIAYGFWASFKADNLIRKASLAGLAFGAVVLLITSQVSSFFWGGFPWVYLGVLVAMAIDTLHPKADSYEGGAPEAES